jgi:hypothetical protein
MVESRVRRADQCLHCWSLDTVQKGDLRVCRDCGAVCRGGEVIETGYVDLHYSLEVQAGDGRALWIDTLDTLFEAQSDIAVGLGIKPGSSFTKWLRSRERTEGVIDDAGTIESMQKIVRKMTSYAHFVRDPYNRQTIDRLNKVIPNAVRFQLTLKRR